MKGYTFKDYNGENMARAMLLAAPVSFKHSVEICRYIKNSSIKDAKQKLQNVIDHKKAVPFRKFDFDLSHKKGTGPGRFPEKASKAFIGLIDSVESNAQFKGLNTSNLIIAHISAHKAGKAWHYGRQSRRAMKRTNIELVVEEKKDAKKEENNKPKKQAKKQEAKND